MIMRLQAGAGNAAVARLLAGNRGSVQRLEAGRACPAPPLPPTPAAPQQDPGFRAMSTKLAAAKKSTAKHPPAQQQARAAQAAAKAPPDDKEAQAKTALAEEMGAAKPAAFDKQGFIAAVNQAIAAQAPKNLDEADKFATSGKADSIAGQVTDKVAKGKQDSAKPLAEKSQQTPDTGKAVDKPVTPLAPDKPGPAPASLNGAAAMPPKAPAQQTELGAAKCETDQKMAEAGVTEQQLAHSNEPEFTDALGAKKEGEAHSATAPAQVRQAEGQQLATAQAGAQTSGQAALAGMSGDKAKALAKVTGQQGSTQGKDEAKRAEVTRNVKGIFDKTKADVDKILGDLDGLVSKKFEEGERQAKAAFTADHKARMDRYKDERYSGALGWARWTEDLFAGLPHEAFQVFEEAKRLYESKMQVVISDVADVVGSELTRATKRVADGRAEISKYVAGLEPSLRGVGDEAAKEIGGQFDDLDAAVAEKSKAVADDLANKYVEARNAVDAEIAAAQEENKGLWDKAKDAVAGAIETIIKLKDMLLGVLARAAGAVEKIIKDPIGFLGNLVNAVKGGVMNFAANIVDHLKKGLQSWLLGALADAGIELPEKFDLKGIIKLILSILGLTWTNIRARLVKVLPEPVVKALETSVKFISVILSEGIGGLWTWIVEQIGDLKEMVLGQIKEFVIEKIVKAGITWLISMLNPAAAFIKACKMIYDVVMFFVEKAAQIKEFVDSILDSVESIAGGGAGAVAGYIEKTLAKMVPVLIGFLASLLGLGGISEKIKKILETVQKPVMKVVDKLIAGAMKLGKSLLSKLGFGKKKDPRTPAERRAALDEAMTRGQAVLKDPGLSESGLRSKLDAIKRDRKVQRLDLVVDDKTADSETVHIVGANSPTVDGPQVVRSVVPIAQRADEEVSATGAETKIEVGGDVFTIWTIGGTSVRIGIEQGDTVDIRSDSSVEAAIQRLTAGALSMDEGQARALAAELAASGKLARQLLLQYVSERPTNAEDFAKHLMVTGTATHAAFQRPASKAEKDLAKDRGITPEGEQRSSGLSSIAHVYYPRRPGEWTPRPIQKLGAEGSKGREFVWAAHGEPKVVSLGVIETDDAGLIVRIISATSEAGGREGLFKILSMATPSWRFIPTFT